MQIRVPAPVSKPVNEKDLVKISSLPDWAQPAFGKMKSLNRIQSKVYETALFTSNNILMCAPTGAGKTNVAMLCVLHALGKHRTADGGIDKSAFKIVYIAPMKALVAEMVGNFTERLSKQYGIQVKELTGALSLHSFCAATSCECAATPLLENLAELQNLAEPCE